MQDRDTQSARTAAHCSDNRHRQEEDLAQKEMFVCTRCLVLPVECTEPFSGLCVECQHAAQQLPAATPGCFLGGDTCLCW